MIFYYDVIYPLTCRIVLHLVQQLKMGSYLKIDIKYIFQTIKVKKKMESWKGNKNREKTSIVFNFSFFSFNKNIRRMCFM